MVFKHFVHVFFTTSTITPYSVVNNKHYAIYGVRVLFEKHHLHHYSAASMLQQMNYYCKVITILHRWGHLGEFL